MISNYFTYNKGKVLQALRYHFITRKEIKIMMILLNVFSLLSAALFFFKKISPLAFLLSSSLWFFMMILFWFFLPRIIYKKSASFKDRFKITLNELDFTLEHSRASKTYAWSELSNWMESPHFFHLYFNATSFFLIPKEAFENEIMDNVREQFRKKVKK
jgi:hypothetical protein